MQPKYVSFLREVSVYGLVSLLVWQPVLVHADVAADALPVLDRVSAGTADVVTRPTQMDVTQGSRRAMYEWHSFDVGRDSTVNFNMTQGSGSIALNKVNGGGGSHIMGKLKSNGVVYLLDRNGVIFGPDSQVNVASLIATSLDLNQELQDKFMDATSSIADAINIADVTKSKAAFVPGENPNPDAKIILEGGASIQTTEGGQVFLFAPEVITEKGSSIKTPGGQTILAGAKDEVYLAASTDPDLRGMLVEVNTGGKIEHAGEVVAERGNITLAALAIKQDGTLKATTSVDANGTIRLLARDGASAQVSKLGRGENLDENGELDPVQMAIRGGVLSADGDITTSMDKVGSDDVILPVATNTLERNSDPEVGVHFGGNSLTQITPDLNGKKATDQDTQSPSYIEVMGKTIDVESGAQIISTGGVVSMVATTRPDNPKPTTDDPAARITLHEGSLIDVSGASTAHVEMERNSLEVELRGAELADSPVQRNDPAIRGKKAYVDLRYGEEIEFADISGYVSKLERTADERLSAGGKVNLYSEGAVDFQKGAQVDVSGGAVHFDSGHIKESRLISDGVSYAISEANPDRDYDALVNPGQFYNQRWNLVQKYKTSDGREQSGQWVNGYTEGKSAGSFNTLSSSVLYDGNVRADVVVGPYQRANPSSVNGGAISIDVTRFTNASQSILLTSEQKFREDQAQNGPQNPQANQTIISVDRFANSADSISIKTARNLTLDRESALVLDGGGKLSLQGLNVQINSDITNHAGDVSLQAKDAAGLSNLGSLTVADNVTIDTSGKWVNDIARRSNEGLAPVRIDAGGISLGAENNLTLGNNALLAANGGGWLTSSGTVKGGKGGDVTIGLGDFDSISAVPQLVMGGRATSYSLTQGGTFSLDAAGFDIGADNLAVDNATGVVSLPTEWFQQGGFSAFNLNAKRNGIDIREGAQIALQGARYQLSDTGFLSARSGTESESLFSVVVADALPDYLKQSVDLNLASSQSGLPGSEMSDGIRMGRDSSIVAQPGAQVGMSASGGDISIDGHIVAKGGQINLAVTPGPDSRFDPSRAVRLGQDSVLDVSATSVERLAQPGMINRDLYTAGTIDLDVQSGYLLAAEGSVVAADGHSTLVTYYDTKNKNYSTMPMDLAAGSIRMRASEGVLLEGEVHARASGNGRAGSFDLAFNTMGRKPAVADESQLSGYTHFPMTIQVGEYAGQLSDSLLRSNNIRQGFTDAGLQNGVAYLDVDRLNNGGFANVTLATSNDIVGNEPSTAISFHTEKVLHALDTLQLQTPEIRVNGLNANIEAPYLVLGTTFSGANDVRAGAIRTPAGSLTARAQFMDVQGGLTFSDSAKVTLDSKTDIRLRGAAAVADTDREAPTGFMKVAGDLDLIAGKVYTSTLADFTLDLPSAHSTFTASNRDPASGEIRAATPLMSAGGHLTVNADTIKQQGVIKAPFGRIDLNADTHLQLESGSVTSVSGEGQTVLFGTLDGVGDWQYKLFEAEPLIFDDLPEKNVTLKSPSIDHQDGATVNVSGSGELAAYYFVAGPMGSADALDYSTAGVAGLSFAIMPKSSLTWTPYDPVEARNFPYAMGDAVRFERHSGLNPNIDYVILPARYALLPGAMLVTPTESTFSPGTDKVDLMGRPVVAGTFTRATGTNTGNQLSNFIIEPGLAVLDRSELRVFSANQFFDSNRPVDAGRVVYDAAGGVSRLNIDGDILARAGAGGVGGRMDINASRIVVGASIDPTETATQFTDTQLEELAVDSILLGGVRSSNAGGQTIAVGADEVEIKSGVDLQLSELLLAATNAVTVRNGASLYGDRAGNTRGGGVSVSGNSGALLQVSSGEALDVKRVASVSAAQGSLVIEQGANVFGEGAVLLDSTRETVLGGDINTAGTLAINSNRIVLGSGANEAGSTILSSGMLNQLTAKELRLMGRESVDIAADIDLVLSRMLLDTRRLGILGNESVSATIDVADTFVFRNSAATALSVREESVAGSGLSISANRIHLEGKDTESSQLAFDGFEQLNLTGNAEVRGSDRVVLTSDGNVNLSTDKLTSSAGSDLEVNARGNLSLSSVEGNEIPSADVAESFASRYVLKGDNVAIDTKILASSGTIEVDAQQNIQLGEHAELDVSGAIFDFAGERVATEGGNILLTARDGNIVGQSGTRMDLSSRDREVSSGTLLLSARNGTVSLPSAPTVTRFDQPTGGSVAVEVAQLDSLASLLPSLRDFSDSQRVYTKRGDLTLEQADRMRAKKVELVTDNGAIRIEGEIDASGNAGGSIELYASDDVSVGSEGRLLANATGAGQDGGNILLASANGGVNLAAGSRFNLSGQGAGKGGRLQIETTREGTDIQFADAGTVVEGADSVKLTGFKQYRPAQAIDQAYIDGVPKLDADSFMAAVADQIAQVGGRFSNLLSQLGNKFEVTPGVEIYSDDDMVIAGKIDLSSDIDLASVFTPDESGQSTLDPGGWRYEQNDRWVAGTMRFRSAGNIDVQQGISDGFIYTDMFGGYQYFQDTPISYDAWTFQLAAGSSSTQTKALSAAESGLGRIDVRDGAVVRTGTGDIAISSGEDLVLGNRAAIYTGGNSLYVASRDYPTYTTPESGTLEPFNDFYSFYFNLTNRGAVRIFYPKTGGDVHLDIGGNLLVNAESSPHTDWLFRVANKNNGHFTWGVLYENFVNGIGALGGGNIDVSVKGNVSNLTLAVPTTAMQIANYEPSISVDDLLDVRGGGDIALRAGGDVLSSHFVVGRGTVDVVSGGRIGKAPNAGTNAIASLIALGEGSVNMVARNDIETSGIVDLNLVPISVNQTPNQVDGNDYRTQFITHEGVNSASLRSLAGDIIVNTNPGHHANYFADLGGQVNPYAALPAQLELTALQGGVQFLSSVGVASHPESELTIQARGDISAATSVSVVVGGYQDYLNYRMTDAIDGEVYSAQDSPDLAAINNLLGVYQIPSIETRQLATVSNSNIFAEDADAIRIVSQQGNITPLQKGRDSFSIELPRQAYISAGGNIEDTKFYLQNNYASDLTYVHAGGDLLSTTYRTDKGGVGVVGSQDAPTVGIQGPGTLLVEAGGDVDLGGSAGIVSWGNRFNTALDDNGADIFVLAGLVQEPDFAAFANRYMAQRITTDQATSFLVAALTGMTLSVDEINGILDGANSAARTSVNQKQHPEHLEVALTSSDTRNLTPAQTLFLNLSSDQQLKVATELYRSASPLHQRVLAYRTLQNEVTRAGYEDASAAEGTNLAAQGKGFTRGFNAIETLFAPNVQWNGDVALVSSTVNSADGGDITILTPGGGVDVGLPDSIPGVTKTPADLGIIASRTGDVGILARDSVLVNQSRIFALDGDVSIWASQGDIDAGRGSKTAAGGDNLNVYWNVPSHTFVLDTGTAISGSGIRATSSDPDGSYVNLSAPQGAIEAGDAGIGATNVVLAGAIIRGADNIDVGGVSIGVPTNSGVSASVTTAGNSATGSTTDAMDNMSESADSANEDSRQVAFLTVEIIGLGD